MEFTKKFSIESKTSVNNSNAYCIILYRKKFLNLPELFFYKTLERDGEDGLWDIMWDSIYITCIVWITII